MKKLAALALAAVLGLTACQSPAAPQAPAAPASPSTQGVITAPMPLLENLPACSTEDYEGPDACLWDAMKRSNGKGNSFVWDGSKVIIISKG
jgi:hypothetical protein